MTLLFLNIKSLRNKINDFEVILHEQRPRIVCLNEHSLNEDEIKIYKLTNYSLVSYSCREGIQGGGTSIYVHDTLLQNCRGIQTNTSTVVKRCEFCCAELVINKRVYLIVCMYRSTETRNLDVFLEVLNELMGEIFHENKTIILCGDFNVHFNVGGKHVDDVEGLLLSYNLTPMVKGLTRVTSTSGNQLDNIFSCLVENEYRTYIVDCDISDHYALALVLDFGVTKAVKTTVFKRNYSLENIMRLQNKLGGESWQEFYGSTEVNQGYDLFCNTFTYYFDTCISTRRCVMGAERKWVPGEIHDWSQKLRATYSIYRATNNPDLLKLYKQERREYRRYVTEYRRSYNDNNIVNSSNVTKSTWRLLNRVRNTSQRTRSLQIVHDGENVRDPRVLAGIFASQFQLINHPSVDVDNTRPGVMLNRVSHTIFLYPTTPQEVQNIISKMPSKYSTGIDSIPTVLLKQVSEFVCHPLAELINRCFRQGVFPDRLKIAKIIPIHKKGAHDVAANYRPVSLLPAFSKVVERAIYVRLLDFFIKNDIFYGGQHGFVPGRSTTTALFQSVNYIIEQIDRKQIVAGVYFDLSKAFDLVNHELLLDKLNHLGVRGTAADLIRSYLNNRKFFVCIKSELDGSVTYSAGREVMRGVPQGSILGPLLFLVFINDLHTKINLTSLYQFADDTSCVVSASSIPLLSSSLSGVAQRMSKWCVDNDLVLNQQKTSMILFRQDRSASVYVNLDGRSVQQAQSVKFLGVSLDEDLCWDEQVDTVVKKINSCTYAVRYLRSQLGLGSIRIFYFAAVQSIISYSVLFWYRTSRRNDDRVFICQKRIIRAMLGMQSGESCRGKFRELGVMTLPSLYVYNAALFVFNNRDMFLTNKHVNSHAMQTRGGDNLSVPLHRTTLYDKGPLLGCVKVYNALPPNIKSIETVQRFKYSLKQFAIGREFYSLDEYYSM